MNKYLLTLILLIGLSSVGFSQKYGYCNAGNLLEAYALKQGTDETLMAYQEPMMKDGEAKLVAFEAKQKKLYEEIEQGLLSQVAIQKRQEALYAEGKELEDLEKEVSNKIAAKRQELLQPILATVQKAIDDTAKEGGYTIIFDESVISGVLYRDESQDVGPSVRAKLGL